MKHYTASYTPEKLERVLKVRMRVSLMRDYDQRQIEILKAIIEFKALRKTLKEGALTSADFEAKTLVINGCIDEMQHRIGRQLTFDLAPGTEYFYIPRAFTYNQYTAANQADIK